jgi:hypothetical protein
MTRDELLGCLQEVDGRLYSPEVQNFFENRPEEIRNRFISFRQEVAVLVGKLRNAKLSSIEQKLSELSSDLNASISHLQREIDNLNNAVAILSSLGSALGLAARVAVLV